MQFSWEKSMEINIKAPKTVKLHPWQQTKNYKEATIQMEEGTI